MDFRTTKVSENQKRGPYVLHFFLLCRTRTSWLLHKKQHLETTIAETALDGTGLSHPFKI